MTVMTMAAKRNLSVAVFKLEMRHAPKHIAWTDDHSSIEKKKRTPRSSGWWQMARKQNSTMNRQSGYGRDRREDKARYDRAGMAWRGTAQQSIM